MVIASNLGYGSEGLCPHCKWYNNCKGSTKNNQISSMQTCVGGITYVPATTNESKNYPKTYYTDFGHKFKKK
jgi:hypothetical protein